MSNTSNSNEEIEEMSLSVLKAAISTAIDPTTEIL